LTHHLEKPQVARCKVTPSPTVQGQKSCALSPFAERYAREGTNLLLACRHREVGREIIKEERVSADVEISLAYPSWVGRAPGISPPSSTATEDRNKGGGGLFPDPEDSRFCL
jgi:hypothetical protein